MSFSRHLWAIVGLAAVLTTVGVTSSHSKAAIKTNPSQVLVVNNTSSPVPVVGTVNLANSATVNLANGASVAVNNGGANPLPVTESPKTLISRAASGSFGSVSINGSLSLYTVPDGKVLVIQQVSFDSALPPQDVVDEADILLPTRRIALNYENRGGDGTYERFNGQSTGVIYVPAGTEVLVNVHRATANGVGSLVAEFDGYLIDAQ